MLVCHTSCGQKQTEPHQDNINYNITDIVPSYQPYTMVRKDKKGNIWTTGEVSPNVRPLSRYDAKSLYNKIPTVTEIKSEGGMGAETDLRLTSRTAMTNS
ncbi:hypothetical protein CLV42_10293 [Chitinophaga ginsengisoli]|uniref:Uncharacterized protein n=2 Tax=Chitinophaga ginsengisoli TaxID=363837 RepID=A0A2P8GKN7_9BACT|nr:hypothetical protein CLV42_10293 [Chitinophaga ginsengisoli]